MVGDGVIEPWHAEEESEELSRTAGTGIHLPNRLRALFLGMTLMFRAYAVPPVHPRRFISGRAGHMASG